MASFPDVGRLDGISGNKIKLFIDGSAVYAVQNLNWKISRAAKPLYGCGFPEAHGVTESGHKTYEIDFEILEVVGNLSINTEQSEKNEAGAGGGYVDPTDIRDAMIVITYPGQAQQMTKTFKHVNITNVEGGYEGGEDASAIGQKWSGFALTAEGLF